MLMRTNEQLLQIKELEFIALKPITKNIALLTKYRKAIKTIIKHPFLFLSLLNSIRAKDKIAIAFEAGGGIGDIIRASAIIHRFSTLYPQVCFDVFINNTETGEFVFGESKNVRAIYPEHMLTLFVRRYDIVYKILQIAQPIFKTVNPITDKLSRVRTKVKKIIDLYSACSEKSFYTIANKAVEEGLSFMDILGLTAGLEDLSSQKISLSMKGENPFTGKRYITVSNGRDPRAGDIISTKCWPNEYWESLLKKIKDRFPNFLIIQVGTSNTCKLKNADYSLLGETTLQGVAAILGGAMLHIDCDCGLVHIAHVLGIPSVVLFGPSNADYVGYKDNINISAPFCGNCWHLKQNWDICCPLGYGKAKCMYSITPDLVFDFINKFIAG